MVYFVNNIYDMIEDEDDRIISGAIVNHEGKFKLIHNETPIGTYTNFHEAAVEAFGKGIDPEYYSSLEEYFEFYGKRRTA